MGTDIWNPSATENYECVQEAKGNKTLCSRGEEGHTGDFETILPGDTDQFQGVSAGLNRQSLCNRPLEKCFWKDLHWSLDMWSQQCLPGQFSL